MGTTAKKRNHDMKRKRTILLGASFLASLAFVLCFLVGKAEATCELEPTDMSVAYGELVTCDITPNGDTDLYRFSGNTGDRIIAEALWVGGVNFQPRIKLIAPDGTILGDTWGPARLDIVLPQTGTYTAIISEAGDNSTGQYSFIVSCAGGSCILLPPPPPSEPPGVNIGCQPEPTDMSVAYGERVTCDIATLGDIDLYRFSGNTGNRILAEVLRVSGVNFQPRIKLIAPDGTILGDTWGPARLDIVLPQTGTYTAIISEAGDNSTGQYAFTVFCAAGSCVLPAEPPVVVDIQLNGSSFVDGDTVVATVFRIANPGSVAIPVEFAIWMEAPGLFPIRLLKIGSNEEGTTQSMNLPPGHEQDDGPLDLFIIDPTFPRGDYVIGLRMVDPVTQKLQTFDLNHFTILP